MHPIRPQATCARVVSVRGSRPGVGMNRRTAALVLVLGGLAACGEKPAPVPETPGVEAPHAEAPRVEGPRRDASRPATPRPGMPGPGSSGAATALNTDVIGAWALDHVEQAGKDAPELAKGRLVLDLKVDGTFAQTMDVATLEGTWVRSGSKLTLVTKSYDGQPLPPDSTVEETTDTLTVEGDVLVISDADVKFFLKRR